jgi:hypothetical protein
MKYLLAQPAITRFEWELDVVLTNILSLDFKAEIVCLFGVNPQEAVNNTVAHIREKFPTVAIHVYEDTRIDKSYAPTIRPFLWYCYLSEDPTREQESYFQIDSDVIFRELPDFSKIPATETVWYGSDCAGYLDYEYLRTRQKGEQIVDNFARLLDVDRQIIEQTPGAGAQWVLVHPTARYWLKVYNDSNKLYHYLEHINSDIQKWTAEMWAQLYNAPYFGIEQRISPELDFCRPTDDVKMWDMVKILHNAGVIGELGKYMFYKGKYVDRTPFGDNLDYVHRDKASIKYVDAIKNVSGTIKP